MIDNSLKSADDIGEHRRPRDLPYRETQRSLDYGSVVTSLVRRRGRARSRGMFSGVRHLHSSAHDESAHLTCQNSLLILRFRSPHYVAGGLNAISQGDLARFQM